MEEKKEKDKGGAGGEIGMEGRGKTGEKTRGRRTTRESRRRKISGEGGKEEEAGLKGGKGRAKESELRHAALNWPVVAARGIPGYPP